MNFLVDAQLPRLLAIRLRELGQTARHTLDLSAGNRTSDQEIASIADDEDAVVITKDADFLDSHLLNGSPSRLLLVSTGNISNRQLHSLFEQHINRITSALVDGRLLELTPTDLIIHD
jgi:predicted nuclease of predicted toxin-antitoxin system